MNLLKTTFILSHDTHIVKQFFSHDVENIQIFVRVDYKYYNTIFRISILTNSKRYDIIKVFTLGKTHDGGWCPQRGAIHLGVVCH